jgi:hypothetical protein
MSRVDPHSAVSFNGLRRRFFGAGLFVLLALLTILGWIFWPNSFFSAYWFGLMCWVQLSIGCLILLLIQFLTGGEWGRASAPLLRVGIIGLFALAPLFVTAFFALPHIFSWTNIRVGESSQMLVNKVGWLNPFAFILRAIFYLAMLSWLARWGLRASDNTDAKSWGGPPLVFVILVISFASSDWMMSIEPSFYSSLYPFMYFSDCMVSAMSALCGLTAWLQLRGVWPRQPDLLLALGKLFFAAVLFWGYIQFSQFIIIWTGNLPDEADWYVVRVERGWLPLTLFVFICQFAIPFCLLLSQRLKRDPRRLLRISIAVFLMHFAEVYWLMVPRRGIGFHPHFFDVVLPLVIGACWIWFLLGFHRQISASSPAPEKST